MLSPKRKTAPFYAGGFAMLLACSILTFGAGEALAGSVHQRPTDVHIVMSTSSTYDGEYQLSHTALICGELKAEENFAGVPLFQVNFPDGGDFEINDVTFSSKSLVGPTRETSDFYLSLNLKSDSIGHPAAYVLDTARPDNTGTAQLGVDDGTLTLTVKGVNDLGGTTDLTVVCHPAEIAAD